MRKLRRTRIHYDVPMADGHYNGVMYEWRKGNADTTPITLYYNPFRGAVAIIRKGKRRWAAATADHASTIMRREFGIRWKVQ